MKSGERPKPVRGLRQESRRFRLLVVAAGFFLVSLTFVLLSRPDAILFSSKIRPQFSDGLLDRYIILRPSDNFSLPALAVNGKLPVDQAPTSILIRQKVNPPPATSRKTSTDAFRKALPLPFPFSCCAKNPRDKLTDSEVSFPCGWL
jgi:hypothetical protein